MVAEYSSRRLTFPRDKLPAIQGLANTIGRIPNMRYLAGHWRGHRFLESLLWSTEPSAGSYDDAAGPVAPSWSWVSVNGMVASPLDTDLNSFYHDIVLLAEVLRSEMCDGTTIPSAVAPTGVTLLMSARVHSLGDAPGDLFRHRMSSKYPEIALKTEWLSHKLLKPQYSVYNGHKDPWGDRDERPWVNIHLDHHRTTLFDLLFLPSAENDCSTEEWHDIRTRDHRLTIMICLLILRDIRRGDMNSECHAHGLLLKRIGEQEGKPVCERIGRITLDLKFQMHLGIQKSIEDIDRHEVYLV
jgi:hypothetical protein